jgi:long-chain acyl-CoA synthetase
MLQGYGLTETSPVVSFNRIEANRVGTVGQAVTDVEIRIADDGEVLTRGPHVMKGYWKDAKATAEAIRDGWFHTGDLGSLDADGYLTITGRKKDLLVLSNGKKVVPTEIEALLLQDDCIDQALVYGEGRNYLTALIVPRFDRLRSLLGVAEQDNAKLIELSAVRELMAKRFAAVLADVAEWEKVQRFALLPRPFTQEAEELTVSLKLRRGVIFQKHKEQMEALYRG